MPKEKLERFALGHDVGFKARELFPGGTDVSPKGFDYREALIKTQRCIEAGVEILYEASFRFNDVLSIMDILVKRGNTWHAFEVKSSTAIGETYLNDAALQFYVIKNSGLDLNAISFIYMKEGWREADEFLLKDYFIEKDVTQHCIEANTVVSENISTAKKIIAGKTLPEIATGDHCMKPYQCDFYGHCHKKNLRI